MNKEELIDAIASKTGFTKTNSKALLDGLLETIQETLASNDIVQLVGFASFSVKERAARKGRNPQTGKEMNIPASKVIKFTAGKQLKEAVNNSKAKKTKR